MQLTSTAFQHNQNIPAKYTCDGESISPPLTIDSAPATAKSLALIVDDPDAPIGDWVHWLVWNIDPATKEIAENSLPAGINNQPTAQGITDYGKPGWGAPCPPGGTHRYQFKLYALDTILSIPASSRKADLEKAMVGHTIDQNILIGLYGRK